MRWDPSDGLINENFLVIAAGAPSFKNKSDDAVRSCLRVQLIHREQQPRHYSRGEGGLELRSSGERDVGDGRRGMIEGGFC